MYNSVPDRKLRYFGLDQIGELGVNSPLQVSINVAQWLCLKQNRSEIRFRGMIYLDSAGLKAFKKAFRFMVKFTDVASGGLFQTRRGNAAVESQLKLKANRHLL